MKLQKLNLMGPVSTTGYGVVVCNLAYHLSQQGVDVRLMPTKPGKQIEPEYLTAEHVQTNFPAHVGQTLVHLYEKLINQGPHLDAPTLHIQQAAFLWWPEQLQGARVALPIFELDHLSPAEHQGLRTGTTHILQGTAWGRDVLTEQGYSDVGYVRCLGVDQHLFQSAAPVTWDKTLRFGCIGKLEDRKGHWNLMEVFARTFAEPEYNDVELWMAVQNYFIPDWHVQLFKFLEEKCDPRGRVKIRTIQYMNSQQDVYSRIILPTHVGVFPYRAEGFNLELLEYMASARPVICTRVTGPTEYLTDSNHTTVPTIGTEVASGPFFQGNEAGQWHVPDWEMLGRAMKDTYETWRSNGKKIAPNETGVRTASEFGWDSCAVRLSDWLSQL